ncbi:uncharacterized protein LOC115730983 [Rhodamnia argentea]|uniref:Uncharacterized protein LOC115730983 n=1 Tax=Rhodamnia argentea TaxID=178133 RepID=A0ABM3HGL3_9MYRT|nr:uncharacterized protein LOC115730983 [Rhodamnia argentea]
MSIDPALPVASFAWDILKRVVVPVKRQFGYLISSKSYAQDLQKEVGKLAYEAEMVHNAVEVARNNCRNVYSHVTGWQAKVEKALKEAGELLEEFEKASKSCCYGTLPDPNCRYQFSRKAKDKIELLQRLARECSEFRDISFIDPAPGNVTAASASSAKDDGVFESRASIQREIMAALADNRNSVVGVHGMGGTGKSTLLEEVERRIREERSFDLVAKADVSENPDIKRIQEEIAHGLGLSDIKKEENVSLRAKLLRERLEDEERTKQENDEGKKKKKVLIILDNLWKGLDLKSVGIPCGHDNKVIGCKLLLTSRFQDVLRREMGCDSDFLLDALKEEEAKRLFERTVGDKVHRDPFKSLVDEALGKCAGLPFLIIAMANVFRDADFREWKDVLRQIEMSTNKGIDEKINEMLHLSYNRFEGEDGEEVKSLLRLCVVYGVSKPSLENLVRYGVGSRLFREDSSMEEVRDRLSSLIQTLKASSFLLADETDADVFKIHDLVRGFVASVASRDDPLLVLKNHDKSVIELPKDKLKSCTSVCFPYVNMEELPEELDCPEMRIFLLFTNNESLKVPVSCFNSMRKLMVLHLSRVRLTCSPSPFQLLENLHTLCLNDCSLEDVAMIGKLKRLCVLSFANSKIQRLPKEIGQLVELRLLDLNHCSKLEIIEPGVLGSLMKLEELYMENSFDRWNAVEQTPPTNAGLIELNKLKNLYTLHVSIFDSSVLPEDLNVEKLTKYQIRIGDVPRERIRNGSSILELTLDPISDILQKGCIQTLLGKTDNLFLGGLNGIEQTICVLSQKGFSKLKHLQVKNSSSVHYVLQSPSYTEFKMLESLLLDNLINLEKICNNHISSNSFGALKVVRVENCNKMEVLFPLSLLRELPQLEEMRVVECHLMREIVEVDDSGKVELPNLRVLELRDLPNIKIFVSDGMAPSSSTSNDQVGPQIAFFNGQQVAFPSLETLCIWFMDSIDIIWDNQVAAESFRKLKSLNLEGLSKLKRVWDKELHSQVKFQCLRSVTVSECESLTSLFPASVARDLMQLEKLKINECGGIVELIEKDGPDPRDVNIVEAKGGPRHELKVIPPFSRFFQHLKTLDVSFCDGLSKMFTPTIAGNLVELTKLRISKCKMLTEVICDDGGEEGLVVVFNQLKYMELDGLTGLRCFSSSKYALMFPLLEDVIVNGCPSMKFFSEGPIKAPKLERVQASTEAWFWEEDLNITIQNMFKEMATIAGVKFMQLSEFPELIEKWHGELIPIKPSWQLESLVVDKCPSFTNAIPFRLIPVLNEVQRLQVCDCESLEEVFNLEGLEGVRSTRLLPSLRFLDLVNLPKLWRLWNNHLQGTLRFDMIFSLTLYKCSNLRHAFTPSMARCVANLWVMEIKECGQMEGVIAEEEGQGSAVEKITFPRLCLMKLECLPNMTNFLSGKNRPLECPNLEKLTIANCPKMRSLTWQPLMEIDHRTPSLFTPEVQFPKLESMFLSHMENLSKIWTDCPQDTLTFEHLRKVKVENCKSLENLFPHWVATSLNRLEKIRVEFCAIKEIVASGDNTPHFTTGQALFPQLTSLVFHDMPQLKRFCPNLSTLNWPFLKKFQVTHCDKLNMFPFVATMNKWPR